MHGALSLMLTDLSEPLLYHPSKGKAMLIHVLCLHHTTITSKNNLELQIQYIKSQHFAANDIQRQCRCPSLHLVIKRLLKVSDVIETISQAHFVSCPVVKAPSINSNCLTQGCGPPPRRGAAIIPRFDWPPPCCHCACCLGVFTV